MTDLRAFVDRQLNQALSLVPDSEILDGLSEAAGQPYQWGNTYQIPRDMAVGMGLIPPTPQEAADMAASREWSRRWHADRIQRRAAWFSAIRDAAYPDAVAMLDLHVPGESPYADDCEGCVPHEWERGATWPCATVLAAAEAVGIPEPEGI